MANYFTQFSCLLDTGSAENAARAGALREEVAAELGECLCFEVEPTHGREPGVLWIHAGECGEPEHVLAFVRPCAAAFGLRGRWGFIWGMWCSRPRLDGFGGGAHVLDLAPGETIGWIDCDHWLAERLEAGRAAPAEAAP